jgi:hypothetical protein
MPAMQGVAVTPAQVLRAARERIAVPERWTQGASARTISGIGVDAFDYGAVQWCAYGAIRVDGVHDHELQLFFRAIGAMDSIGTWNDAPGRTHAEVLDAFDRAIALAEAEP